MWMKKDPLPRIENMIDSEIVTASELKAPPGLRR